MSVNGSPAVLYAKRGAVAWVTLNRPDQFNAYNMAMRDDLFQILAAIHEDTEVRAMVLAGAGPAFSTGGDVSECWARGAGRPAKLLGLAYLGAWTSYYLAVGGGIDPWPVERLDELKRRLRTA